MKNSNMAYGDAFPDEMYVYLDVFCALVLNWVRGQIDGTYIIAVDDSCGCQGAVELE